jgi:thiol-disulfide isomerase/thioredoxin
MNWLNPKKIFFWVGILIILLMSTGVYIYIHNIAQLQNKTQQTDVPNAAGSGGDIRILFFTVTWCPHCQKAKNPWEDFKTKYHNSKTLKGRRIVCQEHDATLDESGESTPASIETGLLVAKYKVQGYPTIIMLKDGEQIDFDAKITTYSLEKFVEDMA